MTEQLPQFAGEAYQNFVKYKSNPLTLQNYKSRFKKYVDYCQVENGNIDHLLYDGDTRMIQTRISDFLIHIQGQGFSSSTVLHHYSTIKYFYEINDIRTLNWKKITMVLKPFRREANDRPYTTAEITKLLEKCDQRGRVIILLMCSSGMREGAIHSLKLAHLEKIQEIYKITVYKNDPEEYITFCSPECTKAIDDYLGYRQRYGEIIKPSSPLIREMFNKDKPEKAASPKSIKGGAIKDIIYQAINDAGIREKINVVKGQKRVLHEVMQSHGLRKYFETQAVDAGMDLFTAELLMGHIAGLPYKYVKPTTTKLLERYLQIVDSVTIDESQKLRREVKTLQEENNQIQKYLTKIDNLYEKLGL